MSTNLDRPVGVYQDPGEDQQEQSIMYHVQAILSIAGAEGETAPDVQQGIQVLMAGLQSLANTKQAAMQPGAPPPGGPPQQEPMDAGAGSPVDDGSQKAIPLNTM